MKPRARFNMRLLEKIRVDNCMTYEDLGAALGVTARSAINYTDEKYVGMPRQKIIKRMVDLFGVPATQWIIWREEQ